MTFSAIPENTGKYGKISRGGGIRHKKLQNCNTACYKVRTEKPLVRKVVTPIDKTPRSVIGTQNA